MDLVTIDIAKKMIEGSNVLDERDCDDDVDDGVDNQFHLLLFVRYH